jgi:hypothetical protein
MKFHLIIPILLLGLTCLLQSCVVNQYRVIETQWVQSSTEYTSSELDSNIFQAKFWCWGENGRLRVGLENKTDSTLYVDLYSSYLQSDAVMMLYSSDTVDQPVYYTLYNSSSKGNWYEMTLIREACDQFIAVPTGQSLVFSKFHLHSVLSDSLDKMDFYAESTLFGPLNSPAKGQHHLGIEVGNKGDVMHLDHLFYVNARRKWIYKDPYKVYLPEKRQHNYFLRSKTFHPAGTFLMLALVSFSIHLGTRN